MEKRSEMKARILAVAALLCVAAIAIALYCGRRGGDGMEDGGAGEAPAPVASRPGGSAASVRGGTVAAAPSAAVAAVARPPRHNEEAFEPTIAAENFEALLLGTRAESIKDRAAAWRGISALSNREKIHWLGVFAASDAEELRLASMNATRMCFGMEAFKRRTNTTYKDVKARSAANGADASSSGDALVQIDMSEMPTKREAAQINDIVRSGMKDESAVVRHEAVMTASSFDIETCHALFQYAMTSCGDDVRLDILRDASYGDPDYVLRLEMAALDVGGDEVVKVASEGIEKATGRTFANSSEAFEWYEANMMDDQGLELVVGEPEDEQQ